MHVIRDEQQNPEEAARRGRGGDGRPFTTLSKPWTGRETVVLREIEPQDISVFFEQQLRFFDRLFITGGFRVEDNSVFGTTTTERGSGRSSKRFQ